MRHVFGDVVDQSVELTGRIGTMGVDATSFLADLVTNATRHVWQRVPDADWRLASYWSASWIQNILLRVLGLLFGPNEIANFADVFWPSTLASWCLACSVATLLAREWFVRRAVWRLVRKYGFHH
jgi:hypothetical protein